MSVELPDGWKQRPAEAGLLEAYPARNPGSGLAVATSRDRLVPSDESTPVTLGEYESWRHEAAPTGGGGREARYVIPTTSGKVEITCAASAGSPVNTLALCERTASTLRLGTQRTMTLAAVGKAQDRWQAAAKALQAERAAGRTTLAAANSQADQIDAAQALAGIYEHAARRFAAVYNGEPAVKAARATAATYRTLARAARSDSSTTWRAAVDDVRAAEARLAAAVAAG
jgi:hypothetical protein